ncbi:hypothetical protein EV426DRAFT_617627 [Tirmania nivea]|nr:hypothetical protein EV426DRAFT_617627 [Tirmania nivea]
MTAASGDTYTSMQSTKAEDTKSSTNASQVGEITGGATFEGQHKGKQKRNKNKKDNKAANQTVADTAAKADGPRTAQKNKRDVRVEDAKLVGPESIEPIGSKPNATDVRTKEDDSEKKKDTKRHTRASSVTVEDVPKIPPAKEEILISTETSAAPSAQAGETPSPKATRETPIQLIASPSTTSSESVPITPTSPPATEPHLDFSPAATFPHAFQEGGPPKHVFHEPNISNPLPNPIHPHQPERATAENLIHFVTAHHRHSPHKALHPQPNRLPTEPILPQDAPIPPPPKPGSPVPPLHVPGPGVTAGRIVMLADPPPPIGCLAPTRERQLTEYNIGHVHAIHNHPGHGYPGENPYPARSLYINSTEAHPTGYIQNPRAAERPGTALGRGPYDSGLGKKNDEDEDDEREGGGLFGRRTPIGATISTKGYHRRGEDVGLVASLVNLWEKSRDWFQEWVQATRW